MTTLLRVRKIVEGMTEQSFQEGKEQERKRIINLLEPLAEHYEECYHNGERFCWAEECSAEIYGYAIKLIKGEIDDKANQR
jgi:hypothetical protein